VGIHLLEKKKNMSYGTEVKHLLRGNRYYYSFSNQRRFTRASLPAIRIKHRIHIDVRWTKTKKERKNTGERAWGATSLYVGP
jgi:hypothetical protein